MRRIDCHDNIKRVKSLFEAALAMIDELIRIARNEPEVLNRLDVDLSDMISVRYQLHDIYFARLFACFETSLRHYWQSVKKNGRSLLSRFC